LVAEIPREVFLGAGTQGVLRLRETSASPPSRSAQDDRAM